MVDAPFDQKAAGVLVPSVVTRPDKPAGGSKGRKRLSDLHGSVTMRDVCGEAEKRRLEDEAKEAATKEKKRLALEKNEGGREEGRRGACDRLRALRGRVRVRRRAVPVAGLEAVPDVRAQEGPVQGEGMCCCAQAAPAGLQPGRGRAGGSHGRPVGRVFFRDQCACLSHVCLCAVGDACVNEVDWGDLWVV
jgi:hypothetical protein